MLYAAGRQDSCSVTGFFSVVRSTQPKTTVTRKLNPCRAAKSLALLLEAGRTLRTVRREGRSTLVLRTRLYNPFQNPVSLYGNKHPPKDEMAGELKTMEF